MPRKVAFSGKGKKLQLQEKRANKENRGFGLDKETHVTVTKIGKNPIVGSVVAMPSNNLRRDSYKLKFSKEKIDNETKKDIYLPIIEGSPEDLVLGTYSFYPSYLDFPKRPYWDSDMSKEQLDALEKDILTEYIEKYAECEEVGIYEQNLETWRQLWRVCEKSDVLLIIVDARFAIAQFPPALYSHLVLTLKKGVILILNKCDLLPVNCINSLREYFRYVFPLMEVIPFCSGDADTKWKQNAEKTLQLITAIKRTSKIKVNYKKWMSKLEGDNSTEDHNEISSEKKDSILTLGTIGHPNVGKSSFINTIMGKKVVSVSKNPGHTKHFQTIFLTNKIVLCDCPGLVFPCATPFPLQVLMGSFPTAQVRNPMAVIGYICKYVNVPNILKLKIAEQSYGEELWSSYLVCEAFAMQKNFRIKRSGNADVYRGANQLLRQVVLGNNKIIFHLQAPPTPAIKYGYDTEKLFKNEPLSDDVDTKDDDSSGTDKAVSIDILSNKFAILNNE